MTFEEAFSEFIDRREYDEASAALFKIVRMAFAAGWQAAAGSPLHSQNAIELVSNAANGKQPP